MKRFLIVTPFRQVHHITRWLNGFPSGYREITPIILALYMENRPTDICQYTIQERKNMTLLEQIRENTIILRAVEGVPLLLIGIVLFAVGASLTKKIY